CRNVGLKTQNQGAVLMVYADLAAPHEAMVLTGLTIVNFFHVVAIKSGGAVPTRVIGVVVVIRVADRSAREQIIRVAVLAANIVQPVTARPRLGRLRLGVADVN